MAKSSGTSMTQLAYEQLRQEILSGVLAADAKINIAETVARSGFNLGAVREALSRLTSEGLVTSETNKGFRVAAITLGELEDLTRTRVMIECACLENAIGNGTLQWESRVVSSIHSLLRTPMLIEGTGRVNPDWARAHFGFHSALVSGCDSPWLLRIREMLYVQAERYRVATVPYDRAFRDLDSEHTELAEAAIARNAERAKTAMTQHLLRTKTILIDAKVVSADPV